VGKDSLKLEKGKGDKGNTVECVSAASRTRCPKIVAGRGKSEDGVGGTNGKSRTRRGFFQGKLARSKITGEREENKKGGGNKWNGSQLSDCRHTAKRKECCPYVRQSGVLEF